MAYSRLPAVSSAYCNTVLVQVPSLGLLLPLKQAVDICRTRPMLASSNWSTSWRAGVITCVHWQAVQSSRCPLSSYLSCVAAQLHVCAPLHQSGSWPVWGCLTSARAVPMPGNLLRTFPNSQAAVHRHVHRHAAAGLPLCAGEAVALAGSQAPSPSSTGLHGHDLVPRADLPQPAEAVLHQH